MLHVIEYQNADVIQFSTQKSAKYSTEIRTFVRDLRTVNTVQNAA